MITSWYLRFLVWLVAGISLLLTLGALGVGVVVSQLVQGTEGLGTSINGRFITVTLTIFALSIAAIVIHRRHDRLRGE